VAISTTGQSQTDKSLCEEIAMVEKQKHNKLITTFNG
jgi:hypothetical protein